MLRSLSNFVLVRVHKSTSLRCRAFGTLPTLRAGNGPLLDLAGLGASREAQYLSREHGIPPTEYSSNVHLIRSSEVDPFAPAPGSTPAVANDQLELTTGSDYNTLKATIARNKKMEEEIDELKTAVSGMEAKIDELNKATFYIPIIMMASGLVVLFNLSRNDSTGSVSEGDGGLMKTLTPFRLPSALHARGLEDNTSEAVGAIRLQGGTPDEEESLANSGPTMSDRQFEDKGSNISSQSFLSGVFWAKT